MKKKDTTKENDIKYQKSLIIGFDKYMNYKDALNLILEEDKEYSLSEVDTLLDLFLRKEVE